MAMYAPRVLDRLSIVAGAALVIVVLSGCSDPE
jgi:hypothetical protein